MSRLASTRLRTQIVLFFGALLAVVQLGTFWLVSEANSRSALREAEAELDIGQRIFQRLLAENGARLAQGVRVLAADYGFREALATGDLDTVASALENSAGRINADIAVLNSLEGRPLAAIGAVPAGYSLPAIPGLLDAARRDGRATATAVVGDRAYQLAVVPVLAPVPVAWLVMGFEIDNALAADLKQLTSLDVSFVQAGGDDGQVLASTLARDARAGLAALLPRNGLDPDVRALDLAGEHWQVREVRLEAGGYLAAVLQRSLSQALAAAEDLSRTLLGLGVLGFIASLGGALLIARGIARPISSLAETAESIAAGNYEASLAVTRSDELGSLMASFNRMQTAVADREQHIRHLAFHDPLTNLPNRPCLLDRLEQALRLASREGQPLSVLSVDLDRFRAINDSLGHAVGDAVLREVAERLGRERRASDTVARLTADEFAVLLPAAGAEEAATVAGRILEVLARPILYHDQPLDVTPSIGIACYPAHGEDAASLLRRADIAMGVAKREQSGHALYEPRYDDAQQDHLSLLSELRRAVENQELRLFYQPKVEIPSGRLVGAEALIRWAHPTRGLVPPMEFIPFAEQTGYIRALTTWLVEEAIAQLARWRAAGLDLPVAVNISPRTLADTGLPERIAALLERYGVPADRLALEITESGFMADPAKTDIVIARLAGLGLRMSIDDYGTGYSSLAAIRKLPVEELKIDRAFVVSMTGDPDAAVIVRSTVELGHSLGLKVVAEGVEFPEHWEQLAAFGCDIAQGFGISRPMPAADLEAWARATADPAAKLRRPAAGGSTVAA